MARPRKPLSQIRKRREISATDDDWLAINAEAAAAGTTISRYLIDARLKRHPDTLIQETRYANLLSATLQCLVRIADGLSKTGDITALGAGLRLAVLERHLGKLISEVRK